jgi:hypothetical protein
MWLPSATFAVTIALCDPPGRRESIHLQRQFPGPRGAYPSNPPTGHSPLPSTPADSSRPSSGASTADERMGPKRLFNGARLSVDSALADFESGTQYRSRHVRRKGRVAKKIDSPEHVEDTARPGSRLARSQWARTLPAQCASHCARQGPIFRVQMPVAHVVGQADNLLVDRQHQLWNRV